MPIFQSPQSEEVIPAPKKRFHRVAVVVLAVFACALFSVGIFFLVRNKKTEGTLIGQGGPVPNVQSPMPTPTPTPEPGMTIALMGRGGAGHDGGALTDTILVARILETQKKILLLSIPRDLWVAIPQTEKYASTSAKINFAYAAGGGALSKQILTEVTGLSIDKFVTIDFSGFEQAIDTIGGVDLTVDRAFTDYEYPIGGRESTECGQMPTTETSNAQYPTSNSRSLEDEIRDGKLDPNILTGLPKEYPCRYELLRFETGKQHMDGKTALKYVRSRHSAEDGNDFARSRRQKILIEAVIEKLFSMNAIAKIPTFLGTLRSHVDMDFSAAEIVGLLPKAKGYRSYTTENRALSTENYLSQGYTSDRQFALTPIGGERNFTAIRDWIHHATHPDALLEFPTIQVTSSWKNSSSSATLVQTLSAAGYPARVGPLVMKNATSSATMISTTSGIDPSAIKKIMELSNVSESFFQFSSAAAKWQPKTDIQVLLP